MHYFSSLPLECVVNDGLKKNKKPCSWPREGQLYYLWDTELIEIFHSKLKENDVFFFPVLDIKYTEDALIHSWCDWL